MWKWTRRIAAALLFVTSGVLAATKRIADWVGRSTFAEDAESLGPKAAAVFEWLTDQPALMFYVVPLVLAGVGLMLLTLPISRGAAEQPKPSHLTMPVIPSQSDERPKPVAYAPSVPLVDMEYDFTRIVNAAPWMRFSCAAYNATGCPIRITSATGRIKIGNEEFHGTLELEGTKESYPDGKFFFFSLKMPVTESEKQYLVDLPDGEYFTIHFIQATVDVAIHTLPHNTATKIRLPNRLQYQTGSRRCDPGYISQAIFRTRSGLKASES